MKRLTIYTVGFDKELQNFAKEFGLVRLRWAKWHRRGGVFGAHLTWENGDAVEVVGQLCRFLQELVALESPVYRGSPKLMELVRGLQNTPTHQREVQRLKGFLRASRVLHIEGYLNFRMGEFRNQLDVISYRAVKKMKLTFGD